MGKKIILCVPDDDTLNQSLAEICETAVRSNNDVLEDIFAVNDYDVLKEVLSEPEYINTDYVILSEVLVAGDKRILLNLDLLSELIRLYPHIRFIVLLPKERDKRLAKLFERGYYDVIFLHNMDDAGIFAKLFRHSRTREEAASFYGIVEPEKEKIIASQEMDLTAASEDNSSDTVSNDNVQKKYTADKPRPTETQEQAYERVEQPYMNWFTINGFVTGFTGPDTLEIKIPVASLPDISFADLQSLVPGSPVNITVSLGAVEES